MGKSMLHHCILAFPDFRGKHLDRKVEMAAKTLGHNLPTPTDFHKELEIHQDGPMADESH